MPLCNTRFSVAEHIVGESERAGAFGGRAQRVLVIACPACGTEATALPVMAAGGFHTCAAMLPDATPTPRTTPTPTPPDAAGARLRPDGRPRTRGTRGGKRGGKGSSGGKDSRGKGTQRERRKGVVPYTRVSFHDKAKAIEWRYICAIDARRAAAAAAAGAE